MTLGVTEPFTTSLKVSFYAALAIVLPFILWQIWSFLAPAVSGDIQRVLGVFVVLATGLFATGVVFWYVDRAPARARRSWSTTTPSCTRSRSARATSSRSSPSRSLRQGSRSRCPSSSSRSSASASERGQAAQEPADRHRAHGRLRGAPARRSTRCRSSLEVVPLLLLFELSIWLVGAARAPTSERGGRRGRGIRPVVRVVSADWVVPVEGAPIAGGAVAIADDGRIAAVGTQPTSARASGSTAASSLPGFVNAHTHLEYAVYAGFGDGLPFVPLDRDCTSRARALLDLDDMRAIATVGAWESLRSGVTTVGDCSFAGATAEAAAATGLRAIVYLEVFGTDERALSIGSTRTMSGSPPSSPIGSCSASRLTLRSPARSRCTRPAPRSGCRSRRTLPRARPSASSSSPGSETGRLRAHARSSARRRPGFACSPPRGCSTDG